MSAKSSLDRVGWQPPFAGCTMRVCASRAGGLSDVVRVASLLGLLFLLITPNIYTRLVHMALRNLKV